MQHLDVVAEDRVMGEHHLEAVELGRIVRPGDLNAAVHGEGLGGEVECRRRDLADVYRRSARGGDPFAHTVRERRAGRPVIASDRDARRLAAVLEPLPRERRVRLADRPGGVRGQLIADRTADVVLPKNRGRELHGMDPPSAARCGREARRLSGTNAVAATAREVEEPIRPDAEQQ